MSKACKICGKENDDNAKKCIDCGTSFDIEENDTGYTNKYNELIDKFNSSLDNNQKEIIDKDNDNTTSTFISFIEDDEDLPSFNTGTSTESQNIEEDKTLETEENDTGYTNKYNELIDKFNSSLDNNQKEIIDDDSDDTTSTVISFIEDDEDLPSFNTESSTESQNIEEDKVLETEENDTGYTNKYNELIDKFNSSLDNNQKETIDDIEIISDDEASFDNEKEETQQEEIIEEDDDNASSAVISSIEEDKTEMLDIDEDDTKQIQQEIELSEESSNNTTSTFISFIEDDEDLPSFNTEASFDNEKEETQQEEIIEEDNDNAASTIITYIEEDQDLPSFNTESSTESQNIKEDKVLETEENDTGYSNKYNELIDRFNSLANSNYEELVQDNVTKDENDLIEETIIDSIKNEKTSKKKKDKVSSIVIRTKHIEQEIKEKDEEYEEAVEIFNNLNTFVGSTLVNKEEIVEDTENNDIDVIENETQQEIIKPKRKPLKLVGKVIIASSIVVLFITGIFFYINYSNHKELLNTCKVIAAGEDLSYQEIFNKLIDKGYSESDIEEALSEIHIDYPKNALNVIYSLGNNAKDLSSKEDIQEILIKRGFSSDDIDYATSSVLWNKYLTNYVDACISKNADADKKTIIQAIQAAGFSEEEINTIKGYENWYQLAVKNIKQCTSNDEELIDKNAIREYLSSLEYSVTDIDKAFEAYANNFITYGYEYLLKYIEQNKITEVSRKKYTDILTKAGFAESEIESILEKLSWDTYAVDEIEGLIEKDSSNIISRKSIISELKSKDYTEKEIEEALAKINWEEAIVSSAKILDTGKVSKNAIIKQLQEAEYTDDEIEYLKKNYSWTTQIGNYVNYLIKEGKAGGESNLVSLLEKEGYTAIEINSCINSYNFNSLAKTAIDDYLSDSAHCSKSKAKSYLEELGYGSTEVSYAMNSVNWSSKAVNYLNKESYLTRKDVETILSAQGYTDSEIASAISNCQNTTGWKELCYKYLKNNFTQEEIADSDKKTEIQDKLLANKFTEAEIAYAFSQASGSGS